MESGCQELLAPEQSIPCYATQGITAASLLKTKNKQVCYTFGFFFSPERFIFLRANYSMTSLERLGICNLEKNHSEEQYPAEEQDS